MSNEPTSVRRYTFLIRIFFVAFGCFAIWWGGFEFADFWNFSSIERFATRIAAGESFKSEAVVKQRPSLDRIEASALCQPGALRSAAIVRLRMADLVLSSGRDRTDENIQSLGNVVHASLSCSPADSYLWLALYWISNGENSNQLHSLDYLRMSYLTGPNEGWIGLKRNRLAFERFDQLPADLAESATHEFVGLVQSGFTKTAAETFMGLGARDRGLILARLNHIPKRYREEFLGLLHNLGYDAG
jgi:hypothetical protein